MSAVITQRLKAAWALFRAKRLDEAEQAVTRILKVAPEHCEANNLMAGVLLQKGYVYKAVAFAQRAVTCDPNNIAARQTYVSVLTAAGERRVALQQIQKLLDMNAGDAELAITHAGTLRDLFRYDEAIALYRQALAKYPGNELLPAILPFVLNYVPGATPAQILDAHAEFGRFVERTVPPVKRTHPNTPEPGRTLRVGVLSADLYQHSVAYFLCPLMQHADPKALHFYCYPTREPKTDSVTARLRSLAAAWRPVVGERAAPIAEKVLADRIDVLIDLNGLTTTTRGLEVMNLSPAPVTVTWLGYPATTGVRSIQYRVVDSITDPPGAERFAVEELARLDPCFLCYEPEREAPAFNPEPPSVRTGHVTFGSFNNLQKLNDRVIALWARAVLAVPGSRLLLKHFRLREPPLREEVLSRFEGAGLPRERVELLPKDDDVAAHLKMYERVDVALDPFPYHGTTTTCEALWMGVPVVTLAGDRHASRVGASLLSAAGLPELVAQDDESFVRTAAALATDAPRLAGLRASLRERVRSSVLCDAPGYARRFESLLRALWSRWCAARA